MAQSSCESEQHTATTSKATQLSLPDQHDVCQRCSSIPWLLLRNHESEYETVVEGPYQNLQQSGCRICRFLGNFFWMRDLLSSVLRSADTKYVPPSHKLSKRDISTNFERYIDGPSLNHTHVDAAIFIAGVDPFLDQELPLRFPETIDFQLIKSWLQTCSDQHGQLCTPASSNLPGLKVIDCERRVVVHAPRPCAYVALSYLWGDAAAPSMNSFSFTSQVPATIEDSIQITRELGFKYLWVDRYCVAQEDGPEKMIQIEQMGSIYAAAQITLVAALGLDPSHGLPGAVSRPRVLRSEAIDSIRLYALPPYHSMLDISHSPWAHRAWTLQEGFMSRRRLIFTTRTVMLVCNSNVFSELEGEIYGDISDVSWLPPRKDDSQLEPVKNAVDCVHQYCDRTLTYEKDALLAVVGVLNAFRDYGVYHLWGVPYYCADSKLQLRQDIDGQQNIATATYEYGNAIDLLWWHKHPTYRRRGFPSWSLIGWEGRQSALTSNDPDKLIGYRFPVAMLMTSGIKVSTKSGSRALSTFVPRLEGSATDAPKQLEICAMTANLPVIHDIWTPGSEKKIGIQFDLGDGISLMFTPQWSAHPTTLIGVSTVRALLIPASEAGYKHPVGYLLLLQSHGIYCERIGMAILPEFSSYRIRRIPDSWMRTKGAYFLDDMRHVSREEPRYHELLSKYLQDPRVLLRRLMESFEVGSVMLR